jgi:hypothetical protein
MKVSLFFRVLLVIVFSFGNCWTISDDNENDGLHRIPIHRMKIFRPNLTEYYLRKFNFNNRKHDRKPMSIKQNNFINVINVGEISIGTPKQKFLV